MKIFSKSDKITLRHGSYFKDGVLYHGWDRGFFACVSTCLWNLVDLYADHKILPERIDFSRSFPLYKNEYQLNNQVDIYPLLFKIMPVSAKFNADVLLNHHTLYNDSDIKKLSAWVLKYFTIAEPIRVLQEELRRKYNIDVSNTLVIYMRGTDKAKEIRSAAASSYYEQCEGVLKKRPRLRIWIQTDQKQHQDYLLEKYPGRAFVIDELPVVNNNIPMHLDPGLEFDRFKFGQYFLAATNLISSCNTIITDTGNVGYWQALFRGSLKDFYQDTTNFRKIGSPEPLGQFNCLPLRYKIRDALQRPAVLRKLKIFEIIKIPKKVINKFLTLRKQ